MSATMITVSLTSRTDDVTQIPFDRAHQAIEEIADVRLFPHELGDVASLDAEESDWDADGNLGLAAVRRAAHRLLDTLAEALASDEVDIAPGREGGYEFVTGGMSHGDMPTEAAQTINDALQQLPENVLHAAGLNLPAPRYRIAIEGQYGIEQGSVHIHDENTGDEVLMWTADEWIEDPSLVYVIANAIRVALTEPLVFADRTQGHQSRPAEQ